MSISSKGIQNDDLDIRLKVDHIGYAVASIDTALDAYKKMGYYQVSPIYNDKDRNLKIVFVDNHNGVKIELIAPDGDESAVSNILLKMKNVSSPYHICYEVENIEETMVMLKKMGFILTKKPAPAIAFDNRRVVFMVNRDVGLIELVENKTQCKK
jgi:methylmalonyl-CoA/ethylmalonyl-CoA epimerase